MNSEIMIRNKGEEDGVIDFEPLLERWVGPKSERNEADFFGKYFEECKGKGWTLELPGLRLLMSYPIHSATKYNFQEFKNPNNWFGHDFFRKNPDSGEKEVFYRLGKYKGLEREIYYILQLFYTASFGSGWYQNAIFLNYSTYKKNIRFVKKITEYLTQKKKKFPYFFAAKTNKTNINVSNQIDFCKKCNSLRVFEDGLCAGDCFDNRRKKEKIEAKKIHISRMSSKKPSRFPTILGIHHNPDESISQKIRYLLIEKTKELSPDGSAQCQHCGRTVKKNHIFLEIDHILPVSKGGKTTEDNLQVFCRRCNQGKSNYYVKVG